MKPTGALCADRLHSFIHYIVGFEKMPRSFVRRLSARQRSELEEYAVKVHLRLNDNPVRVPPRPAFVPKRMWA